MLCTMLYTEFLMLKCLHSTQKDLKFNSKFEHVGPTDELLSVYVALCQSFAGFMPSHLREYIQFTGRFSWNPPFSADFIKYFTTKIYHNIYLKSKILQEMQIAFLFLYNINNATVSC